MRYSLIFKLAIAAAALLPLGVSAADARQAAWHQLAGQADYSGYIGPDGHYADLSDFTRAIQGTPCGIECTERHERLWSGQLR
jgi:hypothetical protein